MSFCTFLLFLWNKARACDENILFMVKIEGNCRRISIIGYTPEGDVESYTKRPATRSDLLQFLCTQERRGDWAPTHWLAGFYFTVDIGRNKQGIYWRVRCQSDATIFGIDDRGYVVNYRSALAAIYQTEIDIRRRLGTDSVRRV